MPTYLDVGAVRIQAYLGRSKSLAQRRAASARLAQRLSRQHTDVPALLLEHGEPGFVVNDEAAEVDGVLSLVAPDGADETALRRAALHVLGSLHDDLPACHFTVRWGPAPTYSEAFPVLQDLLEWLPALPDFPPLSLCATCGLSPSLAAGRECADCTARSQGPRRRTALDTRPGGASGDAPALDAFGSERRLLEDVRSSLGRHDVRVVTDLDELARMTAGARRNHIATVFADGNGLGGLFEAANRAAQGGTAGPVKDLSKKVKEATWAALRVATVQILRTDEALPAGKDRLPVVPHVVGGDDVLVSVPADRVWPFLRRFLGAFAQDDGLAKASRSLGLDPPTMSAGIVICTSDFSFSLQTEIAETLMRQAKSAGGGRDSTFAWVDVTDDGYGPPQARKPWSLADLEGRADGLTRIAALPASARSAIAAAERVADRGLAQYQVTRIGTTTGGDVQQALRALVGDRLDAPDGPTFQAVADALSLARWWSS